MKSIWKRLIAIVLMVVMALSLNNFSAFAMDIEETEEFSEVVESEEVLITDTDENEPEIQNSGTDVIVQEEETVNAFTISRDDGTWLFPLASSWYNSFSDWAGCPGADKCVFCGVYHSGWGDSAHSGQGGHNGIDIAASSGTSVMAAAAGKVYNAAYNSARGYTVIIEHDLGNGYSYYSYYQHLSQYNIVSNGTYVQAGTVIGKVGNSGNSGGYHLHFGIVMGTSGQGKADTGFISTLESKGWLTSGGNGQGRILNNPASSNDAGFPTGYSEVVPPLKAHYGSVHYTFSASKVTIGTMGSTDITISGENSPGTLTQGSYFSITGTVQSGVNLTNVTAGVYNVDGAAQTSKSASPNSTSYNIANLDSGVYFNNLEPGVYTYKVTATNSGGTKTLVSKVFIVLSTKENFTQGTYIIKNGSYALDIAGHSSESGANMELGNLENTFYQAFWVQSVESGYYYIINCATGKYLDVCNGASAARTNVQQYNGNGSSAQKWQILPAGDRYCLVPQCGTENCLDIQGGTLADGTNVQIYTANLMQAQRFDMEKTDCSGMETGHKISFDLQGGSITGAFATYTATGVNVSRGSEYLVIYNVPGTSPGTNVYGKEVAVSASGCVSEVREYGSDTQLTVPSGGFIVSGHSNYGAGGFEFTRQVSAGDYVGYDYSTKLVSAYHDQDSYLAGNKYVGDGTAYGTLPVPEKEGYIFDGWYSSASGGTKISDDSIYSVDTLYAHWISQNDENPFVDVSETAYYYDAVLWAYENGITTGKDATHFLPDSTCTRAQVVTFLWRAKGEPEPATTENPFVDVKTTDYYYKAVLWAYENGITTGKDSTHFLPDVTVERKQFVTFLWRAENQPSASISNPFADVPNGQYYTTAVLWAYENGITTGKDATHFQPENGCTRAQVAAFLYRAYQ